MDAIFFMATREQALGAGSSAELDDAGIEPVGDPLPLPSLDALLALVGALGLDSKRALAPLRDATCRSHPVFVLHESVADALIPLNDEGVDAIAAAWCKACDDDWDADLYELASCLSDIANALRGRVQTDERLYVLLEERAW